MPRHVVFVGAPTSGVARESPNSSASHRWHTVIVEHSPTTQEFATTAPPASVTDVYKLPHATLEEASRRISRLYENIIFVDVEDPEQDSAVASDNLHGNDTREMPSAISWISTLHTSTNSKSCTLNRPDATFLRPTASFSRSIRHGHGKDTQESQETNSYSQSYNDSSDASVARFPHFHFSLHSLTSLVSLSRQPKTPHEIDYRGGFHGGSKQKVNVLVAVLEAEGPDTIRIKNGRDAGKEVTLFKIVVGDEEGQVCRLTAWREVAERWGGVNPDETAVQRGDVVYLQDIQASSDTNSTSDLSNISLTASPALKSAMLICYRTMPRAPDRDTGVNDERFRPDLRLGFSDATVRKVSNVVRWFEEMAGLPHGYQA
ncbi:hypothetical protein BDY19DRAFT_952096 [Irpex rosettiformis]|uniref:Uncharacterized protein n=1 Tax=Irpex rosettiformis TaxID=378272 RepID=A0ACB8U177_9APHY|nr:hypothetical protein BDY19DRAFT_952096 [Irpex rosettiformis]